MSLPISIDLTTDQIKALAEFAGFNVEKYPDSDPMPVTISTAPDGVDNGDGTKEYPAVVVYSTDYPEEGVMPL